MKTKVYPRCGIRPKAKKRNYCRECEAERKQEREKRFEQLVEWCRAEGIRELARREK